MEGSDKPTPGAKWSQTVSDVLEQRFPPPVVSLVEGYICILDLDLLNTPEPGGVRYAVLYERGDPNLPAATVIVAENMVYQASEAKQEAVASDLLARLSAEQTVASGIELLRRLVELRVPAPAFDCLPAPHQGDRDTSRRFLLLDITEAVTECDVKLSPLPSLVARFSPYLREEQDDPLWVGRLTLSAVAGGSILPYWRRCAEVISRDASFPASAREFLQGSGSPGSRKGLHPDSPQELWKTFFGFLNSYRIKVWEARLRVLLLLAAFLGWQPELTPQSPVTALTAFQTFLHRCTVYSLSGENFKEGLDALGYVVILPSGDDDAAAASAVISSGHSLEAIVLYSAATPNY